MTASILLKLGRVSNLPTVWTNAIAGAVLVGAPDLGTIFLAALALTAFYEGGMWLNDAFDAEIDAVERADRPIPNGDIRRSTVFLGGFAFLTLGIGLAVLLGAGAACAGLVLAGAIVLYDWAHKRTALGPVIMGATRFLCYVLAAYAVARPDLVVILAALGLWAHTIGLTYAAKQEAYDRLERLWPLAVLAVPMLYAAWATGGGGLALVIWAGLVAVIGLALRRLMRRDPGDVPKAVVRLIAAMSLYDAVLIAGVGETGLALLAVCGFALTLALQRWVAGT